MKGKGWESEKGSAPTTTLEGFRVAKEQTARFQRFPTGDSLTGHSLTGHSLTGHISKKKLNWSQLNWSQLNWSQLAPTA